MTHQTDVAHDDGYGEGYADALNTALAEIETILKHRTRSRHDKPGLELAAEVINNLISETT